MCTKGDVVDRELARDSVAFDADDFFWFIEDILCIYDHEREALSHRLITSHLEG